MTDLTPAGYIVADHNGATADIAWADMERTMSAAGVNMLDDYEDSSEQLSSWSRPSHFKTWPATQALLDDVATRGGAIGWTCVGRIACTYDESCNFETDEV
jgi:hypothetical protein